MLTSLLKKSERVDKKYKRTPNMSLKLLQPSAAAETKTPLGFSVKKSPVPPGKKQLFSLGGREHGFTEILIFGKFCKENCQDNSQVTHAVRQIFEKPGKVTHITQQILYMNRSR